MASPFPTLFDATRPMRSIDPFLDLSREMNRMMDSFFPGAGQLMGVGARMATHALPRVDVQEDEQAIVISAELPGVDIGDIDVQLEGDALTLSGEKRARSDTALERYRLMERSFGSFRRTLALPFTPDPGSVTAEHAQGVLTIRIPKTARVDESRRIPVHPGPTAAAAAAPSEETPSIEDLTLAPEGDGR